MRRKGITIWELYLERFVLGAAVLFLVGFTAWQFLSEPNSIEQGSEVIRPGEIDDQLRREAEDIQARLTPGASSPMDIPDPPPVLAEFRTRLESGVSPVDRIVASNPPPDIGDGGGVGGSVPEPYVTPTLPAPGTVATLQFFDAIAEEEISERPELAERFGDPPYDTTWVTAATVFDRDAVLDAFRSPGASGEKQIPLNWYDGEVKVLDVRVEREELIGDEWTNRTLLSPILGQTSLREELAGDVDKRVRNDMFTRLSDEAFVNDLLRPDYYELQRGSFVPPDPRVPEEDETVILSEEEQELRRLTRNFRELERKRDKVLADLEEMGMAAPTGGAGEPEPAEPARPGRGGEGGDGRRAPKAPKAPPGAGAGVGMQGPGSGDARRGAERDRKRAERLRKRLEGLETQLARAKKRIEDLGGRIEEQQAGLMEQEDGTIFVWAHDEMIEPGAMYRYRFTLEIYNPFFARKLDLVESQHHLADSISMSSAPSPWSTPRETIPRTQIFVTKAYGPDTGKGQLGLGQATAEVYRFANARWWLESFTVEPGDRIGGIEQLRRRGPADPVSIDYGTEWYVLDIVDDIDADRQESDRGLGAWVLLQEVDDSSDILQQSPVSAAINRMRDRLRSEVEIAEDEAIEVAAAGDESAG